MLAGKYLDTFKLLCMFYSYFWFVKVISFGWLNRLFLCFQCNPCFFRENKNLCKSHPWKFHQIDEFFQRNNKNRDRSIARGFSISIKLTEKSVFWSTHAPTIFSSNCTMGFGLTKILSNWWESVQFLEELQGFKFRDDNFLSK